MTEGENQVCHIAYMRWKNPHSKRMRDDIAFEAGFAAACEAKRVQFEFAHSQWGIYAEKLEAERARAAALIAKLKIGPYSYQRIMAAIAEFEEST